MKKNKEAFISHHELHRLIGMLFELCNAPKTFQSTMEVTLSNVKWPFTLIYLKDIKIFSRTREQHNEHVCKVLLLSDSADTVLKLNKCNVLANNFNYLGQALHLRHSDLASPQLTQYTNYSHQPLPQTWEPFLNYETSFGNLSQIHLNFVPPNSACKKKSVNDIPTA